MSEIPVNEYYEYFGPDYILDVKASNTDDLNTSAYLERVKRIVLENIRHIGGPPSVQMTGGLKDSFERRYRVYVRADIPSMPIDDMIEDQNKDEDLIPPDERRPRRLLDSRRQADGELSDSDDEGEGGRRNHASYRDADSAESNGGLKFGIGVGILAAGSAASTHGAGPSGHTTTARMAKSPPAASMDLDPTPSDNTPASNLERQLTSSDEMAVDTVLTLDKPSESAKT